MERGAKLSCSGPEAMAEGSFGSSAPVDSSARPKSSFERRLGALKPPGRKLVTSKQRGDRDMGLVAVVGD